MGIPELLQAVEEERPDVLGLNCSTHTFQDTIEFMRQASESLSDAWMVLGGYHSTFTAEHILRDYPFIDYIIKGEGEFALVQLLDCLEAGEEPDKVDGISYLRDGEYVDNPLALIEDLDALPPLDRSELGDLQYGYVHQGIPLTFGRFTTMVSSRGCPYDCRYCSCASFSLRRWRSRSPESVVDELEQLYREGYKTVVFVDDNFTQKKDWAMRICDLILERGIDMSLYCEGRVNNAGKELLGRMKEAGFDVIFFGSESASPHVLEFYNKRTQPEQVLEAVRNAKEAGMMVITSFIMGAPVETEEDLQRTVDFIRELRPHAVEINILDYLVGTKLWMEKEEGGELGKEDWKTNHRAYEYQGSLSRETLQSYVDKGYSTYLDSWKCRDGYRELAGLIVNNRTARRVILHNIFNRNTWSILSKSGKVN
jgi:radical SAM superfamily enzyme YgiQ (UPF0313 family)